MASNLKSVNWFTVVFSGVGTALLIFAGNVVYQKATSNKPHLVYNLSPVSTFKSAQKSLNIHSGLIENSGDKLAEDVLSVVTFPQNANLIDHNIQPTDKTVKYVIRFPDKSTAEISVPSGLNPKEGLNFSFLIDCNSNEALQIDLRGKGIKGELKDIRSNKSSLDDEIKTLMPIAALMAATVALMFLLMRGKFETLERMSKHKKLAGAYHDIDTDAAIEAYKKVIDITPDDANTHSLLSLSFSKKDMHEEALREAMVAIELEPKEEYGYYCLAVVYARKGMLEQTFENLKKSIEHGKKRKILKRLSGNEVFDEFKKSDFWQKLETLGE